MDRPMAEAARMDEPIVPYDGFLRGHDEAMGEPLEVLARFSNLSGKQHCEASPAKPTSSYRLLSQSLSFRLLAGTVVVLFIAAVLPTVFNKKSSSSTASTANATRPAWQPGAPAPTADTAPTWSPQVASRPVATPTDVVQTAGTPSGVGPGTAPQGMPSQGALSQGASTQAAVTQAASPQPEKAPAPALGIANAPVAVSAANIPGLADANRSAVAIDNVRHAVAEGIAKANTAVRNGGVGAAMPAGREMPLTWDSFSRRFDAQTASVVASANVNRGIESPRSENSLPAYPTTNTPDGLTIGSPTATVSDRDPSAYFNRK